MLWSIDSCQNRVSADQHHLTVPRGRVFLKLSADKLPVSNNRRLKFIFSNDSYEICCVYVTMALHCQDFDFKLTSDAKIQPVFFKKYRRGGLFLTMVARWSPSTPNFYTWLVKNWQMSSWGKFMQHLESCLLWGLKLTGFHLRQLVMYLTVFLPLNVQNEIQLLSRVFCYSWLI